MKNNYFICLYRCEIVVSFTLSHRRVPLSRRGTDRDFKPQCVVQGWQSSLKHYQQLLWEGTMERVTPTFWCHFTIPCERVEWDVQSNNSFSTCPGNKLAPYSWILFHIWLCLIATNQSTKGMDGEERYSSSHPSVLTCFSPPVASSLYFVQSLHSAETVLLLVNFSHPPPPLDLTTSVLTGPTLGKK